MQPVGPIPMVGEVFGMDQRMVTGEVNVGVAANILVVIQEWEFCLLRIVPMPAIGSMISVTLSASMNVASRFVIEILWMISAVWGLIRRDGLYLLGKVLSETRSTSATERF